MNLATTVIYSSFIAITRKMFEAGSRSGRAVERGSRLFADQGEAKSEIELAGYEYGRALDELKDKIEELIREAK